MLPLVALA